MYIKVNHEAGKLLGQKISQVGQLPPQVGADWLVRSRCSWAGHDLLAYKMDCPCGE